jgi:hypothetical protein
MFEVVTIEQTKNMASGCWLRRGQQAIPALVSAAFRRRFLRWVLL